MAPRAANPLLWAGAWLILLFLFVPVLITFPVSFTDTSYLSLPTQGVSLRHYQALLADPQWLASAGRSALVASISAVIATLLGGLCAFACWQLTGGLPGLIRGLMLLPLIIPHIVSALAFRRTLVNLGLFDTFAGAILADVIISMPYAFVCVAASLTLFDPKLLQAARSLGASRLLAMRRVLVPSILPGLLSGLLFSFITSWDELVILLFITSRTILLPRKLLQGIQDYIDPSIAAVASIFVILTAIGVVVAGAYRRRAAA